MLRCYYCVIHAALLVMAISRVLISMWPFSGSLDLPTGYIKSKHSSLMKITRHPELPASSQQSAATYMPAEEA